MSTSRKRATPTPRVAAKLLEQIAERIEAGDRSFDLQRPLTQVEMALGEIRHKEGLQLLTRIGLLLLTVDGQRHPNAYVQRAVDDVAPLDPVVDGAALRTLATELDSWSST